MAQTEEQIRDEMKRIVGAHGAGLRFPVMTGTIISVDSDGMTCEVQLTCNYVDGQQSTTPGVFMNVFASNVAGMYLLPVAGASCEIAELDGPGSWSIIRASSYTKVMVTVGSDTTITVTDGLIQFNDGSLGGMVEIQKLNDNLNAIKSYLSTLNTAIANAMTAIGAGSSANGATGATSFNTAMAGQEINIEDMENTKIKQG